MPLCRRQDQRAAVSQQQALRGQQLAWTLQHLPCSRQLESRTQKHAAQLPVGWLQPGWDLQAQMPFLLEVRSLVPWTWEQACSRSLERHASSWWGLSAELEKYTSSTRLAYVLCFDPKDTAWKHTESPLSLSKGCVPAELAPVLT